jgi:hypothetical protein
MAEKPSADGIRRSEPREKDCGKHGVVIVGAALNT